MVVVPAPAATLRLLLALLLLARAVVRAAAKSALAVRAVGGAAVLATCTRAAHAIGAGAVEALLQMARVAAVSSHLGVRLRGEAALRRRSVVSSRAGAGSAK